MTPTKLRVAWFAVIAVALTAGCMSRDRRGTQRCDPPYRPYLTVVVLDAATGVRLGAGGFSVSAALADSAFVPLRAQVDLLPARAGMDTLHYWQAVGEGRYSVRVRHSAYLPWDTADVRVGEQGYGSCKQAAHVVARLQRAR